MRLGVFGGSFDPPHLGHYLAAVDAAERLRLDRLLWVPTGRQPLKTVDQAVDQDGTVDGTLHVAPHEASPEQRFAMVGAALRGTPDFVPSRIEIDRDGLSYTVTTVEAIAREFPSAERFLLVGEDAWASFERWHEPERIRTHVQIAVLRRAGGAMAGEGEEQGGGRIGRADHYLPTRVVELSSTEIRARVKAGKSIRGFVNDGVAALIESEGLYRW